MPSICSFVLDKENAIYFGGETIVGRINLETTSDKNVREVAIIFLGESKVDWKESRALSNNSTSARHFSSHETHINNKTLVHGDGVLKAGRYEYTFNIDLPLECPSSCEGVDGHTRYEISLKIDRYYQFDNNFKIPVTIIKEVDLNLDPIYKFPIEVEAFSSSCWPCSEGRLYCVLKIPHGAYICGQIVTYVLYIANQSIDDTEGYTIQFRQIITMSAKTPYEETRQSKRVLLTKTPRDICVHGTKRLLEGEFVIPDTCPSTERSNIICVAYELKVIVRQLGCNRNTDLKIPIIIGTIAIRESVATEQTPAISRAEDDVAEANVEANHYELSPPTFEEAMRNSSTFVDTDIQGRNHLIDL